jgi:hypothetical protein
MKSLIKLFLFGIIVLFGISCNQESESSLSVVESPVENIGKIHNDGLDFIFSKLQSSIAENNSLRASNVANTVSSIQIATLSRNYLQTIPQYSAEIAKVDIELTAIELDKIRADFTSVGIQNYWKSKTNSSSFKSINLSSLEQKAVTEIEQIFLKLSTLNLSVKQQYDYIKANTAKIKSTYEGNLLANNQGELLSGLLEIMSYSNDYWYNLSITTVNPIDPIIPFNPLIVQVDAAGYLIAWIKAYSDDHDQFTTQEAFSANAKSRVKRGLYGALTASGIRAVVNYF